MSSTAPLDQRYMRAMAHIPLLSMASPQRALVIGFGVGNTTHAVTLHPTIERVEVADLSRDVLNHASYFGDVNGDLLRHPRVSVFLNDGRQHLLMQDEGVYDLVTLEPPPIGYAGVASLYSREFYALAASRLRDGGAMSQWLPAYQVPTGTTLAMVRAFLDVFPGAVLLSGAEADLLLVGVRGEAARLDPDLVAARLRRAPAVQRDLARVDLGTVTEIAGMFVGSSTRLASATSAVDAVTDDRPMQEYGVLSLLNFGQAVPGALVNLDEISAWCPRCFVDGAPAPAVAGLDVYLRLLQLAYTSSLDDIRQARMLADREGRTVAGSRYLGGIVPETAAMHNVLGISLAASGNLEAAIAQFREAASHEPESADTQWHLGAALASVGSLDEAVDHLRRAITLDPAHAQARADLEAVLALQTRGRRPSSN
jgi:tetratricopeptide (TPR) repeat protein